MTLRLLNAGLPGLPGRFDVTLADGRIAAVAPAADPVPTPTGPTPTATVDLAGALLLPALVDGHVHLDKTFLGAPWMPHRTGDGIAARIAAERAARRDVGVPVATRARRLIDRVSALGTVAMRSHVDIDEEIGLANVEALLALRAEVADVMDVQLVAFPQSGLTAKVRDLMDAALGLGVEVVGGLDPAGIDGDVEGHLGAVFALAERHGGRVDVHLHDPGELGAFELRQIAARTRAAGLVGRVAVSHAFALGMVDDAVFGRTAAALAEAGVAIMTNGPGAAAMPPVGRLLAAGVTVFGGSDNIRDAWSPFGDGDMLARAALIGYRADFRHDHELEAAFALASAAPRAVIGMPPVAIEPGAPADLVAVDATCLPEAVATHPPRRLVVKAGQILMRV
ncbi:amidohydrolase [Oharaeibacter diazotrophicus]|uniref:Cytosine/adenosine deaminase-related metal-dependent hydrolase n=2 Tax=Oharaeibacter diazotrophicus TaxID=1920512 RepID=A0A4V3CVM8_9HYPH|nr:amidohydrolase [Oharaeibacter diazotrophicus]TDP83068.1 cytosine/adenosine deaminase-related metal-dependent hydrolase [Oharaeibacter diazotrophicus]GLS78662.1 cytosine deaminase [Oharaeibacter diazotrophicus]